MQQDDNVSFEDLAKHGSLFMVMDIYKFENNMPAPPHVQFLKKLSIMNPNERAMLSLDHSEKIVYFTSIPEISDYITDIPKVMRISIFAILDYNYDCEVEVDIAASELLTLPLQKHLQVNGKCTYQGEGKSIDVTNANEISLINADEDKEVKCPSPKKHSLFSMHYFDAKIPEKTNTITWMPYELFLKSECDCGEDKPK